MKNIITGMQAKRAELKKRVDSRLEDGQTDAGSLLIDVLIGMAIVALVALIAVSSVGSYREKAAITSQIEDAKNYGLAVEAANVMSTSGYPAAAPSAASVGVTLSPGNSVGSWARVTGANASFSFKVLSDRTAQDAVYNSAQGGYTGLVAEVVTP